MGKPLAGAQFLYLELKVIKDNPTCYAIYVWQVTVMQALVSANQGRMLFCKAWMLANDLGSFGVWEEEGEEGEEGGGQGFVHGSFTCI